MNSTEDNAHSEDTRSKIKVTFLHNGTNRIIVCLKVFSRSLVGEQNKKEIKIKTIVSLTSQPSDITLHERQ